VIHALQNETHRVGVAAGFGIHRTPPPASRSNRARRSWFAEHIARLFPNVPKLEMFAREKRDGWDVWGNEAPTAEAADHD
jgi:hypothetical protein